MPSLQKIRRDIPLLSFDDLMQNYRSKMPTSIHAMLILNRQGSVLSANSILKADIAVEKRAKSFRKLKLNDQFKAVKFRFLEDVGIATCSQPPALVIENILKHRLKLRPQGTSPPGFSLMAQTVDEQEAVNGDGGGGGGGDVEQRNTVWIDLREEPVLYIRTRPYVLRNYNRPYQRLPEFGNLTALQIENIAERLKVDINHEALDNDNKMLVHFETQLHELKESSMPS